MAKKNEKEGRGMAIEPLALVQGVILSQLLWLIMSIGSAIVVYFSSWPASQSTLAILAHLAVLGGGFFSGVRCSKRAWLHGVVLGILVFLIFSYVGYGEPLLMTWPWWKALLKMVLVAMLGGITGGLLSS